MRPWNLIEVDVRAVGQDDAVKRDGQSRLAERVHGARLAEHAGAGGNHEMVRRVDRHAHETVHGSAEGAVESIGQDRLDDRALEERVLRFTGDRRCGRTRRRRRARPAAAGRRGGADAAPEGPGAPAGVAGASSWAIGGRRERDRRRTRWSPAPRRRRASWSIARTRRCPRRGRGPRVRHDGGAWAPGVGVSGAPDGEAWRQPRASGLATKASLVCSQLRLLRGQSLGLFLNAALILLDPLLIRIDGRGGRRGRGGRARLRRRPRDRQDADHHDGDADEHPLLQVPRDHAGWQLPVIDDASGRGGGLRGGRGLFSHGVPYFSSTRRNAIRAVPIIR